MLLAGETYSSTDVARELFKVRVAWFYGNRRRLEREEGFPPPISRFGWPRWSGAALLAWQARPKAAGARPRAGGLNVMDLQERARALAQGR